MGKSLAEYFSVAFTPLLVMIGVAVLGFFVSLGNTIPILNIITVLLGAFIGIAGFMVALIATAYVGFAAGKKGFGLGESALAGGLVGTINGLVVGILNVISSIVGAFLGVGISTIGGLILEDVEVTLLGGLLTGAGGLLAVAFAIVGVFVSVFAWAFIGLIMALIGGYISGAGKEI